MATVYSYVRFSSKKQDLGTSLARQKLLRDSWLLRHPQHVLDKTLNMHDHAVSAYRGLNLSKEAALGKFIECVENKQIAEGSILLLEKLDRFSRNEVDLAYTTFSRLIRQKIKIVTLEPEFEINENNFNDMSTIFSVIVQMVNANASSKNLSHRLGHFWNIRRKQASENKKKLCSKCPSWLKYNKDKDIFEVIEEKAEAVKYIFARTNEGIGQVHISKEMYLKYPPITKDTDIKIFDEETEEIHKTGKKSAHWNKSYIHKILHDRSVIGEFQAYSFDEKKKRKKIGDPVENYFPAIISNELFDKAQISISKRIHIKGPNGDYVNILSGLVYCNDGHIMHIRTSRRPNKETNKPYIQRRLVSYGFLRSLRDSCKYSIDVEDLTDLILAMISNTPLEYIVGTREEYSFQRETKILELIKINTKLSEYKSLLDGRTFETKQDILSEMDKKYLEKRNIEQELKLIDSNKDYDDLKTDNKSSRVNINRYIKTLKEKEKRTLRLNIRQYLPTIINRIEISPRKRSNRVVEGEGKIVFHSGVKFSFILFNSKDKSEGYYIGKNLVITENGMISDEKFKKYLNSFIIRNNSECLKEKQLENIMTFIEYLDKFPNPTLIKALNTLKMLKNQEDLYWIYASLYNLVATVDKNPPDKILLLFKFLLFHIEWLRRLEDSVGYEKVL